MIKVALVEQGDGGEAREVSTRTAAVDAVHLFSPSLVTIAHPQGAPAEAVGALRTYVMTHHVHEGRRALAVCAASLGVGCTFTAVNLAVALSQIGVKTLLIDANMRAPGVDLLIRRSIKMDGLRQCLGAEEVTFSDGIDSNVLPNLSVMYSGGVSPNAQELLSGHRFKTLMEFCLRDFEATILDTPAANGCSDARRISTVVGYSLLVARINKTNVEDLKTLTSQLQDDRARVVGTVLNEA
jgi:protein-tyrosine kinase